MTNNMVEHIESCFDCIEYQEQLERGDINNEELARKQYDCFNNSQGE